MVCLITVLVRLPFLHFLKYKKSGSEREGERLSLFFLVFQKVKVLRCNDKGSWPRNIVLQLAPLHAAYHNLQTFSIDHDCRHTKVAQGGRLAAHELFRKHEKGLPLQNVAFAKAVHTI